MMSRHGRHVVRFLFASLTWCAGTVGGAEELKRQQFPGFSIELPEGKVVGSSQVAFAGRHEVRLPEPGVLDNLNPLDHRVSAPRIVLSWAQHGLDDDEYNALLRGALLKSLPGNDVRVLKENAPSPDVHVVVLGQPGLPIAFGTRRCERGFNVSVMVAVSKDVDEEFVLAKRIAESIRCALTDANRRRLEAATRLPAGFVRVMHEPVPTYLTLSGEHLVVNFTAGNQLRDSQTLSVVFKGLLSEVTGVPVAQIRISVVATKSTPERQTGLLYIMAAGDSGYVGALWCPKIGVTFMGIYTAPAPTQSRAAELLDSLGCPGEPSEEPRDAKPLFEASCKDGDADACTTLKQHSF